MSGGSMDYAYSRVNDAVEELEKSTRRGGNHPVLRQRLANHLRACSEALQAIEWADSGDTLAEDWLPLTETVVAASSEAHDADTQAVRTGRALCRMGLEDCARSAVAAETGKRITLDLVSLDCYRGTMTIESARIVVRFEGGGRYEAGPAKVNNDDGEWQVTIDGDRVDTAFDQDEAEMKRGWAEANRAEEPLRYYRGSIYNRRTDGRPVLIEIPPG